jgi:hypothetical protein
LETPSTGILLGLQGLIHLSADIELHEYPAFSQAGKEEEVAQHT